MKKHINRLVAVICVTTGLLEPAAVNAQTVTFDSQQSPEIARARTWTFPTRETAPAPISRALASNVRVWTASSGPAIGSVGTLRPRTQLRTPRIPNAPSGQRSRMYKDAQRVTAAFALGFVGFWAGMLTTYSLAAGCNCGGNETLYIGGFTGAALGATAGYLLVR